MRKQDPSRPRFVRPRRFPLAVLAGAFACLLLSFSPISSRADIYQWEDSRGTLHFTDDISTIPQAYRKKATQLMREAPSVISPLQTSPPPGGEPPAPSMGGLSQEEETARDAARQKEELASEVEQQKAKIAAKEKHIREVDDKRSLAVNPLRNRLVDQADLDLYDKYMAELPGDKERLKETESRLESIK